jgi:2-amino-4-hydroxy-6-hydroxymethyldihydropteridine diphosphokinase
MPTIHLAYLSLGSNVEAERNLPVALRYLQEHGQVVAVSRVYQSAPQGGQLGENARSQLYLNAAVALHTELEPQDLRDLVLRPIEARLGRSRTSPVGPTWVPIDLDLIFFDERSFRLGKRQIPDPDILRFAYLAVPLAEIAPHLVHPQTGETLAAIARRLSRTATLTPRPDVVLRLA